MSVMGYRTILEAIHEGAASHPDKKAWTFLNDKGDPVDGYTYQQLDSASSALAEYLLGHYKQCKGDRVLLVFFPGLDFTVSLLACFKAGVIAVPVFPPDPRRLKKDLHHFVNIQLSCGATTVLSNSQYNFVKKVQDLKSIFSTEKAKWPELRWIQVDDVLKKGKLGKLAGGAASQHKNSESALPLPSRDDVAFLQYTSGSTSEPKGVIITHGNLAHNLTLIITELRAGADTVNVSWLPQYHDMGLIGSYLGVVYCGGSGYYLSPISFLKDANIWLTAISTFKGTHTQAPNFAYALATRKFKEAQASDPSVSAKLELASLRHMINAAEPVDFNAIADFYATFRPFGLPGNVVVPTYGLAEHTVFVCSGGRQVLTVRRASLEQGRVEVVASHTLDAQGMAEEEAGAAEYDAEQQQRIVGCGYPGRAEGLRVLIVSDGSSNSGQGNGSGEGVPDEHAGPTVMGDDAVGEIWLDSASKAQGYWGKPELAQQEFHAMPSTGPTEETKGGEGKGESMGESKGEFKGEFKGESTGESKGESTECERAGFLRTGDLGFMHAGELFICGRVKDLIIMRGSNHYPQDIERTAEQAHGAQLRAGCSAAFSLAPTDKSSEAVVYIAELKEGVSSRDYEALAASCREVVSAQHGLSLSVVCLLETRSVPKTTSGKIARAWCRRGFLEGSLRIKYRLDSRDVPPETLGNEEGGEEQAGEAGSIRTAGGAASSGKGGYQRVQAEDGSSLAPAAAGNAEAAAVSATLKHQTEHEVRALSKEELVRQLESILMQVASQGPAPLSGSVDPKIPVSSLGLDSMTIVQFKGVIEKRYYCDIPDDFLFTSLATLSALACAVQLGHLTEEQQRLYQGAVANAHVAPGADAEDGRGGGSRGSGGNPDPDAPSTVMVVTKKEPCCPWFVCCY